MAVFGAFLLIIWISDDSARWAGKHPDWSWPKSFLMGAAAGGLTLVVMVALLLIIALALYAVRLLLSPYHRHVLNDLSYALTDLRAMALRRSGDGMLRMASYDSPNKPKAMLRKNGSGDVTFGYKGHLLARWGRRRLRNSSCLVFENIDEAATVYRLTQAALDERERLKAQPAAIIS